MKSIFAPQPHSDFWLKILLALIANSGALNRIELDMPNVEFPTMGGGIFWENLAAFGGWRIQKNIITCHCRILDPEDTRRAWGTAAGMRKAFKSLVGE